MAESTATQRIAEEQVQQIRAKYGRAEHVVYNGIDLVFRQPSRPEAQRHAAKLASDSAVEKAVADEQLAQAIVEHCDGADGPKAKEKFTSLLDRFPYATRNKKVGGALARLLGVTEDEEGKD